MSESLAVLFQLGKALRSADSAEFCEQYDDRLLKQTGLSYITLINQKECVRQISELDDEDFSLLQSALVAGGDDSTTPLRLELDGGHLAGSVADQLECLLERLRTEKRGRVSEDSGTISDMDSGCGTTVEEECVRSEANGERDSVYTAVNGSSRANSQQTRFKHSSDTVPSSELERERERERDVCDGAVWSRTHNQQRQRRKGARDMLRGQIADNPHRPDHPKYHGSTTHTRHTDQRFRPRAEVIEHTTHRKQKSHDPATLNTKPAPLSLSEEVPSEIHEGEDDSSPTEGGPFITHWGKGRWRKNTNTRGKRQYNNAHQFYPHPRPKFSQQGVNSNTGTRYPQSRGDRSVGYNSRQERDTNYYRGSERGKEGYRDGGSWSDHTVQQRGGDTPHSHREPPNRTLDRERSPRRQKVESSTDSSSKEESVITSETVAAVKISVELPAKPPAKLQSEKPLKRLSYASVTGSSGSGKSTGAKATQSPASAENNHEEQKAAKHGHCKPVVATTSTTTVQDHVSGATPTVHANKTTTTTSANINHEEQMAAKNNNCKQVVATTSTTSGPNHGSTVSTTVHVNKTTTTTSANINHKERTVAKSGHCKQVVATTSTTTGPDSSGTTNSTTTTIAHTNQTTTTTIHTNRDNSGSNPAATTTAHSATKKGPTSSTVTTTGPKDATPDQTRPTGDHASSTNEAIAASFNYSEAVDFLWRGWQEVQLEQSGPTEVQRSANQSRQSSRKPTRSPIH